MRHGVRAYDVTNAIRWASGRNDPIRDLHHAAHTSGARELTTCGPLFLTEIDRVHLGRSIRASSRTDSGNQEAVVDKLFVQTCATHPRIYGSYIRHRLCTLSLQSLHSTSISCSHSGPIPIGCDIACGGLASGGRYHFVGRRQASQEPGTSASVRLASAAAGGANEPRGPETGGPVRRWLLLRFLQ